MNYYAHTAEDDQGKRLPKSDWQPLAAHLSNAAGLLHDGVKDSLAIGTGN
jgi:hypothetical protein